MTKLEYAALSKAGPYDAYIDIFGVIARTRISRDTVYRKMRTGEFPKPKRALDRRSVWLADEVDAWLKTWPRAA